MILYNFFSDAPESILEQWRVLNQLRVEKVVKLSKPSDSLVVEEDPAMQDLDDLNFEGQ